MKKKVILMKTLKNKLGFLTVALLLSFISSAQTEGVSIKPSPSPPHASAMLDVESNNKGILIPHVALTNVTLPTPVSTPTEGLLVYNTATITTGITPTIGPGFYYWSDFKWNKLSSGSFTDLWTVDPTVPSSPVGGIFRKGVVTIGQSSVSPGYTNPVPPTSTLQVFGPAIFYAQDAAPALPNFGIHIGDPNNYLGAGGGHANEINHYNDYLDIQYSTGQDVHMGAWKGSNLSVYGKSAGKGNITAEWDVIALHNVWAANAIGTSDINLKKNIEPMSDVLPKLSLLQAYQYNFKTEGDDEQKHIGIIAQDAQVQFPQLVSSMTRQLSTIPEDGNKSNAVITTESILGVDYSALSALLLQALKEQQAQIEALKARVTVLERK